MKIQLIPYHSIYSKEYDVDSETEGTIFTENLYPEEATKFGTLTDLLGCDDKPYYYPFCLSVFQYETEDDKTFLGNIRGYVTNGSLIHDEYQFGDIANAFFAFDAMSLTLSQFFYAIRDKYIEGDYSTILITQYPEKAYGLESSVLRLVPYCMDMETDEMYITNGFRELFDDDFVDKNEVMKKKHTNYLKSKMVSVNEYFYKKEYGIFKEVQW